VLRFIEDGGAKYSRGLPAHIAMISRFCAWYADRQRGLVQMLWPRLQRNGWPGKACRRNVSGELCETIGAPDPAPSVAGDCAKTGWLGVVLPARRSLACGLVVHFEHPFALGSLIGAPRFGSALADGDVAPTVTAEQGRCEIPFIRLRGRPPFGAEGPSPRYAYLGWRGYRARGRYPAGALLSERRPTPPFLRDLSKRKIACFP